MKTCDELELPCNEEAYYYIVKNKESGELSKMLSNDYQNRWKEFDFIEATDETVVLQEGYEPIIKDFSIYKDGIDYTDSVLSKENAFLLICYNIDKTSSFKQKEINSFYEECSTAGIPFYSLSASSDDNILLLQMKMKLHILFILQMKLH